MTCAPGVIGSCACRRITACSGTWFWVGQVAEEAPALVRRCHDEGHEIACHTWDHAHYDDLSADEQRADIERTRQALATITGTHAGRA